MNRADSEHGRPAAALADGSWSRAWPYALVAAVAAAVYLNTLSNEFVYDDKSLRVNPQFHDPWNFAGLWGKPWWGDTRADNSIYRPLTSTTLALTWWLNEKLGRAGDSPLFFHVFNVAAHAVASALALACLRAIGAAHRVALAAALLFATNAIHVEAVAPVTGRSEMLALAFGVLFLLLHMRRASVAGCVVAFLAALGSKESALAFLPLAWFADVALERAPAPSASLASRVVRHASYVAAAGVWLAARAFALRRVTEVTLPLDNPMVGAGAFERVLTASVAQLDYLRFQLVPVGLQSDTSFDQLPIVGAASDARVVIFALILAAAIAWAAAAWKRTRVPAFAVLGYAISFAPTSNFLFAIGTARSDRLAYAPSLFFCLVLALALARALPKQPVVAWTLIGALVCGHGTLTVARNRVWRDEATFFREQVRASPRSAKAHFNLGATLAMEGDNQGALREYDRAIAIHPRYHLALQNKGHALRRLGRGEEAIGCYLRALESEPRYVEPAFDLAATFHDLGRDEAARQIARQIAKDAPRHPRTAETLRMLGLEPERQD